MRILSPSIRDVIRPTVMLSHLVIACILLLCIIPQSVPAAGGAQETEMLLDEETTTANREQAKVEAALQQSDNRVRILLLFSGVTNLHPTWTMQTDIWKWQDVDYRNDRHVHSIGSAGRSLEGQLNAFALRALSQLFPRLEALDLSYHSLSGEFYFGNLPQSLKWLYLFRNRGDYSGGKIGFSGTPLGTTALPSSLMYCLLHNNRFTGTFDSDTSLMLPDEMKHLTIDQNRFTGVLDLGKLPRTLTQLKLAGNRDLKFKVKSRRDLPAWSFSKPHMHDLGSISVKVEDEGREVIGQDLLKN